MYSNSGWKKYRVRICQGIRKNGEISDGSIYTKISIVKSPHNYFHFVGYWNDFHCDWFYVLTLVVSSKTSFHTYSLI